MLSYYLYPLGWTIVNATGDAIRGFSAHPGDAVEIAFPGADQTQAARIQITASCDTWHQELADLEEKYKRTALKSAFFDRLESQRERIYTARRNGGAGDHYYGVVAVRARAGPRAPSGFQESDCVDPELVLQKGVGGRSFSKENTPPAGPRPKSAQRRPRDLGPAWPRG